MRRLACVKWVSIKALGIALLHPEMVGECWSRPTNKEWLCIAPTWRDLRKVTTTDHHRLLRYIRQPIVHLRKLRPFAVDTTHRHTSYAHLVKRNLARLNVCLVASSDHQPHSTCPTLSCHGYVRSWRKGSNEAQSSGHWTYSTRSMSVRHLNWVDTLSNRGPSAAGLSLPPRAGSAEPMQWKPIV
jgi:hypothetical protein